VGSRQQNRGLSENVEVLRADNEAKSKIVQDYLMKEKVGIIGSSSSPHKDREREEEHKSRLANISGSLVHLPANLSNLSPLTSKKKASAQVENVMGTNKKLQDVVEETMMKNIQLQVRGKSEGNQNINGMADLLFVCHIISRCRNSSRIWEMRSRR